MDQRGRGDNYGKAEEIRFGPWPPGENDMFRVVDRGNFPPDWNIQATAWVKRKYARFVIKGLYSDNDHIKKAGGYLSFGDMGEVGSSSSSTEVVPEARSSSTEVVPEAVCGGFSSDSSSSYSGGSCYPLVFPHPLKPGEKEFK